MTDNASKDSPRTREIEAHLEEAGRKFQELRQERHMLLGAITDSYKRQATNRDDHYRAGQMAQVTAWLERLTKLNEEHPQLWMAE